LQKSSQRADIAVAFPSFATFRADFSWQAASAGLVVALVGYAASVAVVIQGLTAVGATTAQVSSALFVLAFCKGLVAVGMSLWTRMPISIAWTTPGAALLAATGAVDGGFPAVVGAFIVTGALIMATGFIGPLARLVEAIPKPIANAMLAGVLLKLCLAPFIAIGQLPVLGLIVFVVWAAIARISKPAAVPGAVIVALTGTIAMGGTGAVDWLPTLTLVRPELTLASVISIALPLFIVTMTSQNITGLTVLSTFGYHPSTRLAFGVTGLVSVVTAPLAALTINLAAITAALAAGPDAHPDRDRRYIAAVFSGVGYIVLALLAGVAASIVTRSPPLLIEAVAGLALLGALGSSLLGAVSEERTRVAALVTFCMAASGISFLGIGAAFWGLVLGVALDRFERLGLRRSA
jgi:benzoate membrane transport protein